MTEAEWLACEEPTPMLEFSRRQPGQRKLRLFACACARRVCDMGLEEDKDAVETAERFAEGRASDDEVSRVMHCLPAWSIPRMAVLRPALAAAKKIVLSAADLRGWKISSDLPPWTADHRAARDAEKSAQCLLLRCIFGNPFRPVTLDYARLPPSVTDLATAAYEERLLPSGDLDSARLMILADALEEAGAEGGVLLHLRSPGPHVRGCWVVDLLLGR